MLIFDTNQMEVLTEAEKQDEELVLNILEDLEDEDLQLDFIND